MGALDHNYNNKFMAEGHPFDVGNYLILRTGYLVTR